MSGFQRTPSLAIVISAAALACAGWVGGNGGQDSWLRLDAQRGVLVVTRGASVEIRGSGHLEFTAGRQGIRLPGDWRVLSPGGAALPPGRVQVDQVELVDGSGEVRWNLRPVAAVPDGAGTRIRDDDDGGASFASEEDTRFYLTVELDGSTEFFRPAHDGVDADAVRLQRLLDRYSGYGLSAVVAFSDGQNQPLRVVATGTRDGSVEGPPMHGGTLFELGSLTKQLTAASILGLQAAGRLSVDDSLATWDPELPPDVGRIRLRQILLHTSGLPENVDVLADDPSAVWQALEGVRPEFDPGTNWRYSNFGYTVLAALVERLSPNGYISFVEDSLLGPTGIEGIGFPQRHDWPADRTATGGSGPLGTGRITERWPVRARGWNDLLGASGAVASIPALHDWFRALWSGRVLPKSATRQMFEEQPPEISYGWFYMRDRDSTVHVAHGGDTEGTQTFLTYTPSTDQLVALGVNDKRGWRGTLLHDIPIALDTDSLPPLPPPVVKGPFSLDQLTGNYVLADGSALEVTAAAAHVVVGGRGEAALAMLTGADTALARRMAATSDSSVRFLRALVGGDSSVVREILAASGRSESFWNVWGHLRGDHPGNPTGFQVLGTIPDRADRLVSFSTIRFSDGDEILRLVWRPNLDGWGTGGGLPSRSFWPVGSDRLVSFDPTRDGWVGLEAVREPGTETVRELRDAAGRTARRR